MLAPLLAGSAGAAAVAVLIEAIKLRKKRPPPSENNLDLSLAHAPPVSSKSTPSQANRSPSTPSTSTSCTAGAGGPAAYESAKAVDEYLSFHFGSDKDLLPYSKGPKDALHFPARCAMLCERHCSALMDFTGEHGPTAALDLGCAVGGATFELASAFEQVLGIDYSHAFVEAANTMKKEGWMHYKAVMEGDISATFTATVSKDTDMERITFMQGDACNLPTDLPAFDAVLAANLLCRLPDPQTFLLRTPSLVKAGGVLVLVSPYSWLDAWTPRTKWVGGFLQKGQPLKTLDALTAVLDQHFELVATEDMPFLIREHARKFQWGCSQATVWKRRA